MYELYVDCSFCDPVHKGKKTVRDQLEKWKRMLLERWHLCFIKKLIILNIYEH